MYPKLARGLVRRLVRETEANSRAVWAALQPGSMSPPLTQAGLQAFVKQLAGATADIDFAQSWDWHAAGVTYYRIAPHFQALTAETWRLAFVFEHLDVAPCRVVESGQILLPCLVTGHALERMFGRMNTLDWTKVRDELAPAPVVAMALQEVALGLGLAQLAVPTRNGVLLGALEADALVLTTFVDGGRLYPLLRELRNTLVAAFPPTLFEARGVLQVASEALPSPERLATILEHPNFGWLHEPYEPGVPVQVLRARRADRYVGEDT